MVQFLKTELITVPVQLTVRTVSILTSSLASDQLFRLAKKMLFNNKILIKDTIHIKKWVKYVFSPYTLGRFWF